MTGNEERCICGLRYVRDSAGFIWVENKLWTRVHPARWLKTAWSTFEQIEEWRGLKPRERS